MPEEKFDFDKSYRIIFDNLKLADRAAKRVLKNLEKIRESLPPVQVMQE